MSRRPLSLRRKLAALACAAPLLAAAPAAADTCSGLMLNALTPAAAGTTPVAAVVGDFNRDGLLDVVAAGSADISVLLGNGTGGFTLEAGSPILTGGGPVDLAVGDLDRDGYLDLVVALGTQVKVMRRLAAGGFDNTSIPFAVGPAASRIYLAELTHDARLDLIVVSNLGNRISAWEGTGLSFPNALPVIDVSAPGPPEGPSAAAIGDFNRDGKLDLAVAFESSNDVHLYFGNGLPAGSFSWTNGPSISLVAVSAPRDIAAGDVDLDGWPDLVTANSGSGDASVLRNSGGTLLLQAVTALPVGGMPTRVALVDLDHDGALDLAALDDSASPHVVSFRGLPVTPPWFDVSPCVPCSASLPPLAGARGLAVGRFTADGRADLVTALSIPNQVVVIRNDSGTPCARASFAGAPRSYPAGSGPVSTAAADFNHDGRMDLVAASTSDASIRILSNVSGGFTTGTPLGPLSPAPRAVAVADMNVDGNMDVIVAQGAAGSGRVQVFLADFAGTLTPGGTQAAGNNLSSLVVGDFSGDGAPDVVAASEGTGQVFAFLGDGLGGLGSGTPFAVGSGPRALVAGFLDTNATLDVAVANFLGNSVTVLPGNGTGGFGAPLTLTLAAGSNPRGIATADVDGDGRLDLVTADSGLSQVSVIRRDGVGNFLAPVAYPVGTNPSAVALVQLEGDSKPEIAVTSSTAALAQMLMVLANNGSGLFTPPLPGFEHAVRQAPQAITPFDADGDGLVDLAVPCRDGGSVVILLGRPPTLEAAPRVPVGDKPRAAAVGDFDGDGKLDLAVANSGDNSVSLLAGDGAGGLSASGTLTAAAPEAIVSGDFNRDGKLDLAVSVRGATPGVAIFLGTGGGVFSLPTLVNVGTEPDELVTGDFDLDGDLDIAVCDKVSPIGSVRILGNNGLGGFSAVAGVSVGDKPTSIVAADFDRDGDLDLAVANDDSNTVMILTYATGSFSVTQTLPLAGGDTSPVSLAVGDFDGNATIDLVTATAGNFRLHVYRNQNPSTPLFVTPAVPYDTPYLLQVVAAGDLNLDARPDLVALADGVSILRSLGGMSFDPPQTVVARFLPSAAVIADFNRDGRPDVVVVNEGSDDVSVLASSACSARHLQVSLVSNSCRIGAPYTIEAIAKAFDDGGNPATCATGSVSPSILPAVPLGGPPSLPFVSGEASFLGGNALMVNDPGRYRVQFQTPGIAPVQTGTISLVEGGTTQILGPDSVCPGDTGVYSTNQTFDTYAWTLTPTGPPPFAYTPSVLLSGPPLAGSYTLGLAGRTECTTGVNRTIYFGSLASVSLQIQGPASVCVDCIGGSAKAVELGGGTPTSRQWGYRTISGTGPITPIPGESTDTYVLKGANFPGPGTYYVVVTTTPAGTCGSPTTSSQWTVTVVASVPSGEVRHLAASSRAEAGAGKNELLWVNTTGSIEEILIRWDQALPGTNDCVSPPNTTAPSDGQASLVPPLPMMGSYPHTGLLFNTAYCYSVFVKVSGAYSPGRTIKARPFDSTAGPVKWAYATGGTAVAPPTVSSEGILAMSNDRTVHLLTRGSLGGMWPTPDWMPTELVGVAHSRSPVVPFTIPLNGAANVLFVADDSPTGVLHAVNAHSGGEVWPDKPQGKPVTGAPGGMFTQFGGIRDLLVVGTRDETNPNVLRALEVSNGATLEDYVGGGSGSQIGPINGSPAIDYATRRVYFASRRHLGSGHTLWCLEILAGGPPVFSYKWSRDLGDISTSPVLRGGRVYVGTEAGMIYSVNAGTGVLAGDPADDRTFTPAPADGPVKGFLFPDRRIGNDDLYFATNTKVWSISDDAPLMTRNWEWTPLGPTPNPSVVLLRPQTDYLYVGSANGELYELSFGGVTYPVTPPHKVQVLGGGLGQIGAPSLDIGVMPRLLIVGSEPGVLYGVEVPFP